MRSISARSRVPDGTAVTLAPDNWTPTRFAVASADPGETLAGIRAGTGID